MVTDFIYNDNKLSDFGYALVSFDGIKDGEIDTDSQFSFNHISMMRGKKQPFITSTYDDPLEMEFYIAKNWCLFEEDNDMYKNSYNISVSEMAFLKRWLVSPTPHKLMAIGEGYEGIFWNGSFNVEEYTLGDGRIGAHLTFECDAPFGYYGGIIYKGTLDTDKTYKYNCISDEVGWLYPNLTITVNEDGDLELTNSFDGRKTIIKNCTQGEKITFSEYLQVTTSDINHKIADDFNYVFYRIGNDYNNVENTLESNLSIDFTIEYNPIAKVVIV